jgi:class 3 adenylate cyclase
MSLAANFVMNAAKNYFKNRPPPWPIRQAGGERKHVTVLFSDLSGYTAMSEKPDPEEEKEITGRIFENVSHIVHKYDGFIEKYAGDAVMALFGADQSHEDDPIRAVRAAIEIHAAAEELSPEYMNAELIPHCKCTPAFTRVLS